MGLLALAQERATKMQPFAVALIPRKDEDDPDAERKPYVIPNAFEVFMDGLNIIIKNDDGVQIEARRADRFDAQIVPNPFYANLTDANAIQTDLIRRFLSNFQNAIKLDKRDELMGLAREFLIEGG